MEIQTLQRDIEVQERQSENLEQFIQRVHRYKDLDELILVFIPPNDLTTPDHRPPGARARAAWVASRAAPQTNAAGMAAVRAARLANGIEKRPPHLRRALSRPAFVAGQTYRVLCGCEALTAFKTAMSDGSGGRLANEIEKCPSHLRRAL
jgi:hypothetical protein